jgi:murein DD-endopeptidase MepM/ murein hydrolase activator NlpD
MIWPLFIEATARIRAIVTNPSRYKMPVTVAGCTALLSLTVATSGGCQSSNPRSNLLDTSVRLSATDADVRPTSKTLSTALPPAMQSTGPVARSGSITRNLRETLSKGGLPVDIPAQITKIFGEKLNATSQAQPGDRYFILYERANTSDAAVKHTRITAVEIVSGTRTYSALWFVPAGRSTGAYYSFDGKPLATAPFAMPLHGARISSNFGSRRHPVWGEKRLHTGVDLAAPTGTPVLAAAPGKVQYVGIDSGYGKYVVVSHSQGYSTYYAHLSAVAAGLRVGSQVKQGQRLGAVGSTGTATGPHLHFEIRLRNRPTDPLTAMHRQPIVPVMASLQRTEFDRHVSDVRQQLATLSTSYLLASRTSVPTQF